MYSKEILEQSGLIEAGKDASGEQMYLGGEDEWEKADFLRKEEQENNFDHLEAYKDAVNYDDYIENLENQKGTNELTREEDDKACAMFEEIQSKYES